MQLQNGRPTDTTGRPDKEIRTYDFWTNWKSNIRE